MRARIVQWLVALVVIGALISAYTLTAGASSNDTYTVTADVEQAPNLFAGGRVMVRGVEVGTIDDVEPRPEGVRVTMSIDESVKVPADATMAIVPITVISDRYVQLYPAYDGGPAMEDGDHISQERTSIPAELDEVLAQLKGLLSALEPRDGQKRGPLARLIDDVDDVVAGRSEELAGALQGSAAVLGNLAASEAEITGLIKNLDDVFIALANRSSELGLVNERFELVAEALLLDQENLEGTIENVAFLSGQTSALIDESGDELGAAFRRAANVLNTILEHRNALTEGIKWNNVVSQGLGAVDASGRGENAYTGRQAPVGTEGAAYNYRIDSRDTIGCERIEAVADTSRIVTPTATVEEIANTILSHIPDEYDEHLRFLVLQLIPLCDIDDEPLPSAARKAVRQAVREVGEERFMDLLGRWFADGYVRTAR